METRQKKVRERQKSEERSNVDRIGRLASFLGRCNTECFSEQSLLCCKLQLHLRCNCFDAKGQQRKADRIGYD